MYKNRYSLFYFKTEIKMKKEKGRLLLFRLLLLSFQMRQKRGIADCFKGLFGALANASTLKNS